MIIDLNATIGHYPFRGLQATTAAGVVGLMDRHGIDRAVVSSLPAVFYRDSHGGNEELMVEIAPFRARFIPAVVINPAYVGWERDVAQALEQWKVAAIALVPEFHGYRLMDGRGRAVLERIAAAGVPVMLTQRFEDRRQRHGFDRAEDLSPATLIEVAQAFPSLRFLLVNWLGLNGRQLADAGLKGRVLIDFARLQVLFRKEVPALIAALGVEAVGFGSHLPFDYIASALVKLDNVRTYLPNHYEALAWRNAARFLSAGER